MHVPFEFEESLAERWEAVEVRPALSSTGSSSRPMSTDMAEHTSSVIVGCCNRASVSYVIKENLLDLPQWNVSQECFRGACALVCL